MMSGPFLDLTASDGSGHVIVNMAHVMRASRAEAREWTVLTFADESTARVTETVDEIYNHPAMVMHRHPLYTVAPGDERMVIQPIEPITSPPAPKPDLPFVCKYIGGCADYDHCAAAGTCDGIPF